MRPRRRGQEEGSDLAPGRHRPAGRWGAGPEPPGTDPAARGLTSVPEAVPWTSEPHTSPRPCVDCVTPRGAASSAGSGHRRAWSPVADISRAGAGCQGAGVDVSQASRTGESGCEPFGPRTQGQRPGPPPRDARLATPCVRGGPAARRLAAPHSQTSRKGHALQAKKVRSPKYGSRAPDVWGGGGPGHARRRRAYVFKISQRVVVTPGSPRARGVQQRQTLAPGPGTERHSPRHRGAGPGGWPGQRPGQARRQEAQVWGWRAPGAPLRS